VTYPSIIGLSGVARAGKDTLGVILHDLYGYEIMSFSDVLNRALIALNPVIQIPWEQDVPGLIVSGARFGEPLLMRYATLEEQIGYEGAKEVPEVRALLQRLGTEVGRDILGEDIWVDAMFAKYKPGMRWAIVNVRFPNEYKVVKDYGGEVWHVARPGYEPAQGHISDRALDGYAFDWHICNDGTVKDLDGGPTRHRLQKAFNGGSREG
jgi:hypothetical protein